MLGLKAVDLPRRNLLHIDYKDDYGRLLSVAVDERDFRKVIYARFSDGTPVPRIFFTPQCLSQIEKFALEWVRKKGARE
jgi:hypothetical protein